MKKTIGVNRRNMAKVLAQVPFDLISNLPDNIIDTIMVFLPTRDAIRTSVLSRKLRYRWAKLPQLILDETLWDKLIVKHSARITVTTVLYQVLLLHEGPIYKFTLSIPGLESCPEIDSLIVFLSRNGIEDLTLKMPITESYRLPLSFLTCQQLKHLSLHSCLIEDTFSFQYKRLITLKLCKVTVGNEVLQSLISNSPLLEVLELEFSSNSYDLEIDAPNLEVFSFTGCLKAIRFRDSPNLASVSIEDLHNSGYNNWKGLTRNLVDFFQCLPVLEKLYLPFDLVKSLAEGGVPRWLSTTLVYLEDLTLIGIMLDAMDELSFTLCLIRNSPNLKYLIIDTFTNEAEKRSDALEILKDEYESDVMLNELTDVVLQSITGTNLELEFIKFLLSKSPSLKTLVIRPSTEIVDKGLQILKTVIKFQRASKEAEVDYEEIEEKDQA